MTSYEELSYWLADAGELAPRPPLPGDVEADVAILGAGYTGLWTAYYLLARDPSLRVVVVEAEIAGFGASGRNGAWTNAVLGLSYGELARRYGREQAARTVQALRAAVDEVGEVCAAEDLGAHFHKGGVLRIARGNHELPALQAGYDQRAALGLAEGCEVLDTAQADERVRVARTRGALFDPNCATVHPGRLVRGLADAVESRGGRIYEQTRVRDVAPGRLCTEHGDVRAPTVVLAGEAYLTRLAPLHRSLLPVYSLIVLTEPLDDEQWRQIGWDRRECLSSHRLTVDYLSRTPDGRILFGGRGAPYHYGSRVAPAFDRHLATHARLRAELTDWFPSLAGVSFTHAWGGAVGMPRDWMPTFSYHPGTGVAGAFGYTGQGVAAANLAGQTLADLITGTTSPLTGLPMVNHRSPRWEPEPLRWLAARYLQRSLARLDDRGQRTGRPPSGRSLAERLVRH